MYSYISQLDKSNIYDKEKNEDLILIPNLIIYRAYDNNIMILDISKANLKGNLYLKLLTNLQILYCQHNQIENIEDLDKINLKYLNCSHNKIKSLNLTLLTVNISECVNYESNPIVELHGIDYIPSLEIQSNLKKLSFGNNYNVPFDFFLCALNNLAHLTFGHRFNQPINLIQFNLIDFWL